VADDKHQGGHEAHGIKRYIVVWLTLLAFTALTVITGRMDLGGANIFIAMAIALTKATLVVLFFMHLYDEGGVNRLVFVVSVLFLIVLLLGSFGDLMTRLKVTLPNGGPIPSTLHHGGGAEHGAGAPAEHGAGAPAEH
jgi:cytochrome c oxidase subunit 4